MSDGYAAGILKMCNTYLVRGTDLFSLRLSNKKTTTANTTRAIGVSESKLCLFFYPIGKTIFFAVLQNFSN